jgi:peptide/nickel transport system permease protein
VKGYILRRLLVLIPVALGASIVTFFLLRTIPGDPVTVMLGEHATGKEYAHFSKVLGLDQPVIVQYWDYLTRLLRGNWGTSLYDNSAVFPLVIRRFIATLELAALSMILSAVIGIVLGVVSGLWRDSVLDKVARVTTLLTFSLPTFWLAILLIDVFAVQLGWFPAMGKGGISYFVLPVITLAAWAVGLITRVTRISVLETLGQDYMLTARAKGLGMRRIVLKHLLPNSLVSVVTVVGLQFGGMLGGAVITETVFNYPGMGQLMVTSIFARDYPVVQGVLLVAALSFMAVNFLADLVYARLDPRIRQASL